MFWRKWEGRSGLLHGNAAIMPVMAHFLRSLVATLTAVMILIAGVPGCVCANCSNRANTAPVSANDKRCQCCSTQSGECCCKAKSSKATSVEGCSCSTKAPTAPAPVSSTTLLNLQLTIAFLTMTVELPDTGEGCSVLLLETHHITPLPTDRLIALQQLLL